MSFHRAQAEYEGRMPETDRVFSGSIETYLLEGIHAEKLALLEYDENEIIGASNAETKEEIDLNEISETDLNRGLDALIEHGEYYGN
jgi:hypothetical protein